MLRFLEGMECPIMFEEYVTCHSVPWIIAKKMLQYIFSRYFSVFNEYCIDQENVLLKKRIVSSKEKGVPSISSTPRIISPLGKGKPTKSHSTWPSPRHFWNLACFPPFLPYSLHCHPMNSREKVLWEKGGPLDTSCACKYTAEKGWHQLPKLHDASNNCNWHFLQKAFRQTPPS